jgi:hypothetical protein
MINGKIIYVARISCVLTHNTSVNEIKKLEVLHTFWTTQLNSYLIKIKNESAESNR